jgi:DNA-binding XRE family transcriptional regulator
MCRIRVAYLPSFGLGIAIARFFGKAVEEVFIVE